MNTSTIEQHGFQLAELVDESSRTVVWRAVQTALDRTVIIRILKPEAARNPAEVEHFLKIAQRFARLKSESLAAIFDIVSEGDLHYVVMEHVEGPTLENHVAEHGPVPTEQALRIAASLINSLEQMWETSFLVHRNLKSATIRLDPRGIAKITDFGLAIVAGPGINATAMDGGNIVGTPCFLSPEQAQGSHTLTTQSDMYALGVVLYHLLTGIVPFEDQDVVSVLKSHVKHQIPPPHHLNKAVPVTVSWFIHRLMMKNPNNRYAHWSDALQDIRAQLNGEVPSCVRPGEEFLSTIDASFADETDEAPTDSTGPQIRLNRKEKNERIAAYQSKNIIDEHANEIRREKLIKELLLWLLLSAWLFAVFFFRAVMQNDTPYAEAGNQLTQLAEEVAAQLAETVEGIKVQQASVSHAEQPTPEPAPPEETTKNGNDTPPPVAQPAPAPVPKPAPVPPPVAEPPAVPKGIPNKLSRDLARAIASGDIKAAQQAVKSSPDPFQEKAALQALLDQVPDPDSLVSDFLASQIGKLLIFEHLGKQRTVIPRSVENNVIQLEMNGRGVEYPISKLTPDAKLRWMNTPETEAQRVAYCTILMRSSRRAEVEARSSGVPLLADILIEASTLVPAVTPPAE